MSVNVESMSRERRVGKWFFAMAFFSIMIFTSFMSMQMQASSMRAGLTVGMLIFVIVLMATSEGYGVVIKKQYLKILVFVFVFILMQYMVSRIIFTGVDDVRFALSYFLLFVIFVVSALFAGMVGKVRENSFHDVISSAYNLLALVGVLCLFLIYMGGGDRKSMIIFSEPSHFALVFLPLLLYKTYLTKALTRSFHLLMWLAIALLIKNLTLLVGIMVVCVLLYGRKPYVIILALAVTLIIGVSIGGLEYFLDRVHLSFESDNLSVLVYLSGFERAYLSFVESFGFGLGFQQLGVVGATGQAMEKIMIIMGGNSLNEFDGGALASKIIAELGFLGGMLLVVYMIFFFRLSMNFVKGKIEEPASVFFSSVFVMFLIELFVRGVGYFSPTTFFFAASLYWFYLSRSYSENHSINENSYSS